jgi:hypothetical protein
MPEQLSREDFAGCVGSSFRLCPDRPDAFDLVVEEVSELSAAGGQASFSVLFRGPGDLRVPQGTYPLANERLGRVEIFIVPIARDERGFLYEALFNRLVAR